MAPHERQTVPHERSRQPRHAKTSGLAGRRVHVLGPVCLDLVFSGLTGVPRPGIEVYASQLGIAPGGMANVAVALARLGADVGLSAVFADDPFGQYLWASLADEGIDLSWSSLVPGWNTPVTSSVAVGRERGMVTYEEAPPVALSHLLPEGYQAAALVVSLAGADLGWLAGLHRFAPLVFADVAWDEEARGPFPDLDARLAHVDVFLPNAAEALALTGASSLAEAAAQLAAHGPMVVVKEGAAGSFAYTKGMSAPCSAPAVAVAARDTTGAGDIFDAGFVYGSLAEWPLAHRLRFANLCAAESVKLVGGSLAAPCWRDLAAFWRGLDDPGLRHDYRFLDDVMIEARAGHDCRRSFPALTGTGPGRTRPGARPGPRR